MKQRIRPSAPCRFAACPEAADAAYPAAANARRARLAAALWLALLLFAPHNARAADAPCTAVSIIDDSGRTVALAAPARRIIPLYAGLGETLTALGLADRIVGRTVSDNASPSHLPSVGTHMRPTPELVAGLRPDLVIQFEGREEAGTAAESLIRMGIEVARFRIASFADLYACIERLGILTGESAAASRLMEEMRERLARVERDMAAYPAPPRIFFEVRYPNLLGAGGGSIVNDIISAAGGGNCLAGYPDRMVRLNEEALALYNPEIYLVQQGPMNKAPLPPDERPAFRGIEAVRRGFVHTVPEALFSRPGPGSVDAVENLARIILQWHKGARPAHDGDSP